MCPPIRREWGEKWVLFLQNVCMYAFSLGVVRRRVGNMLPVLRRRASANAANVASGHRAGHGLGRPRSVQ